jgi:hypothetical protein
MASETHTSSPDVRLPLRPRWRDALAALTKAVDPWDRVLVVRSARLGEVDVLVALTYHRVFIVEREPARVVRSSGRSAIRECGSARGELTLETAFVELRLRMRRRARRRMLDVLRPGAARAA